ncbi:peroxiredoxin family protein [Kordia sp.]|uniref:peroxiredoxin family protein n=1 Tax=Kordia sp. TaxID=1965332 RepID=UPI003D2E25E3
MKKIISLLTIVVILATLGYFLYHISSKVTAKQEAASRIEHLPRFELQTVAGTSFTHTNLMLNKATVLLFFNSECDFCQHEAESIFDALDQFTDVQVLFISAEQIETISNFATTYQLNNQPNITFLHDNNSLLGTALDIQSIPTLLIYDSSKQLIKKHTGQLKANGILKIINNY